MVTNRVYNAMGGRGKCRSILLRLVCRRRLHMRWHLLQNQWKERIGGDREDASELIESAFLDGL